MLACSKNRTHIGLGPGTLNTVSFGPPEKGGRKVFWTNYWAHSF